MSQNSAMGRPVVLNKLCETRAYNSWRGMKQRCGNPKANGYKHYGQRNIKVCERWEKFHNFLADMGQPPLGFSLDRIDNDLGYSKENCRWADAQTQARNSRSFKGRSRSHLTLNGETKSLPDWAKELGIPTYTIRNRLKLGWPVKKILETKLKKNAPRGTGPKFKRLDLLAGEEWDWET